MTYTLDTLQKRLAAWEREKSTGGKFADIADKAIVEIRAAIAKIERGGRIVARRPPARKL